MRFSTEKVEASRNFANKIWNAARFILMNIDDSEEAPHIPEKLAIEDKWIISKLNTLAKDVNANIDNYELGIAVQKLYDFIWDCFCDWYIEIAKIRLQQGGEEAANARAVLIYVLSNALKLLHPFMPFITEEIWLTLPHDGESIMISAYPEYDEALDFAQDETEFERIMTAVKAIRNRRAEMNVPPSKKAEVFIDTTFDKTFEQGTIYMQRLAYASSVTVCADVEIEGAVQIITEDAKIFIPMNELVDFEAEKARLNKELADAKKDLEFFSRKLNNPGFMAKAPETEVEKTKLSAAKIEEKIKMLEESIAKLA